MPSGRAETKICVKYTQKPNKLNILTYCYALELIMLICLESYWLFKYYDNLISQLVQSLSSLSVPTTLSNYQAIDYTQIRKWSSAYYSLTLKMTLSFPVLR